uniref:Tyrosine-protein phosphatase domain-containing protein n=1 Tax=Strongyloides papillosus TaxID=174720 RepID=A0A0N5BD64_STREA
MEPSSTFKRPKTKVKNRKKMFDSNNTGMISVEKDKTVECEDEKEAPFENQFKNATIALKQGGRKSGSTNSLYQTNVVSKYGNKPLPPPVDLQQTEVQSGKEISVTEKKITKKNIADIAVEFVDKLIDEGIDRLKKEFAEINRIVADKAETVNFLKPENAIKNRSPDVPCIDSTRVELKNYTTDYIHANYIATASNPKRFICTQSPTTDTINDFWLMIVQNEVSCIGMISDMSKGNKDKIDLYFPNKTNRSCRFGEVKITCKKREKMTINKELRRTTLKVQHNDKSFNVLHYHWAYFPDKTVPEISQTPFQLLGFLRFSKTPIVIHDALGTGRAGILILIEIFMESLTIGNQVDSLQQMGENLRKSRALALEYEIVSISLNFSFLLIIFKFILALFLHSFKYTGLLKKENKLPIFTTIP